LTRQWSLGHWVYIDRKHGRNRSEKCNLRQAFRVRSNGSRKAGEP
jgi:hypothetical protein